VGQGRESKKAERVRSISSLPPQPHLIDRETRKGERERDRVDFITSPSAASSTPATPCEGRPSASSLFHLLRKFGVVLREELGIDVLIEVGVRVFIHPPIIARPRRPRQEFSGEVCSRMNKRPGFHPTMFCRFRTLTKACKVNSVLDAPLILGYANAPKRKARPSHGFCFTLLWLLLIGFAYNNCGSIGWAYYRSNWPGEWLIRLAFPLFSTDFYLGYMAIIWGIACLITVMLAAIVMDLLRVPRWIYLAWLPLLLVGDFMGW